MFFIHLKLKIMLSSYWSLLQICISRLFQIAISLEIANRVRDLLYYCLHGMCILVFEPQLILIRFALFEIPHAELRYFIGTYAVLVDKTSIV